MLTSSPAKIHPVTEDLSGEEADQFIAPIQPTYSLKQVALRVKPKSKSQIGFSDAVEEVSNKIKNRNTLTTSSFVSNAHNSVEALINFLTPNVDSILKNDQVILKKFEELSYEVLTKTKDPELHRLVKSHGWTGTRYKSQDGAALEIETLLQSFLNWYLKHKVSGYTAHISNLFGLGDAQGADQILSFCPDTLLSYLRTQPLAEGDGVRSFSFKGACMLADISGFSKFSGAMCSKGVSGLDDLREATNGFLGHFVKTVYEHHGDVIAFAGDALICVFTDKDTNDEYQQASQSLKEERFSEVKDPEDGGSADHAAPDEEFVKKERQISNCCFRAIRCACTLRTHKTEKLSTHLGISYGEMKLALLGGLQDQWVYLMNGECVSELAGCINDAGPQEVAATPECFDTAMKAIRKFNQDAVMDGISAKRCPESQNYLIEGIHPILDVPAGKVDANGRKLSVLKKRKSSRYIDMGYQQDQQALIESAALFVPRPVLTAVYSESLDHIGELRMVTTMFLSLDSYSPDLHKDPATLQPFFLMAQELLLESGGFLRQFLVDDKGCVLIAMWGMPSFTYSNNCSRALYCAVSLLLNAKKLGHKCSAGVTTGNVFCGSVGALERRDYAGIGNEVNMAARLMSKAKGRTLADKNTYQNLNQATRDMMKATEPMHLKGSEQDVVAYAYTNDEPPRVAATDEQQGYNNTILRRSVMDILSTRIDQIANSKPSANSSLEVKRAQFTIITGLPGTGKSTAAEYFRHGLRKRNIPCVYIQARPGHEGVPYGLMRELFLELIGEDNFDTEEQQRALICKLIDEAYRGKEDEEKNKARLSLEILLGVDWSEAVNGGAKSPSNEPKEPAEPQAPLSAAALHNMSMNNMLTEEIANMYLDHTATLCRAAGDPTFYKVITVLLKNIPTAFIIEDAHFIDELSWNELYLILSGKDLNMSVLITMRANTNAKPVGSAATLLDLAATTPVGNGNMRASLLISNANGGGATPIFNKEGGDVADPSAKYGMKVQQSATYVNICSSENTQMIEMSGLNETEVRDVLLHTLKVDTVSNDLVKLVIDVSSGNAFWVKSIANFIKERGIKELEETIKQGVSPQNSLKVLILMRMEKLDLDYQLVLKHASIIGDEFSEPMLAHVLPARLKASLSESLGTLSENGFILCVEEHPLMIFGFQNQLIRQTLYELMPPRDAGTIHLGVAKYIEVEYAKNLRPFYPILGTHYSKCVGERQLTFKYKVKAADQAISRGAFNDGLVFVQAAQQYARSRPEWRVLLDVITRALGDITPAQPTSKIGHGLRRLSKSFSLSSEQDQTTAKIAAYMQLKISTEAKLDSMTAGSGKIDEEGPPGANKNRNFINRQPSGRLNWQPSYVASKRNQMMDDSDSAEDEEVKKKCCTVS